MFIQIPRACTVGRAARDENPSIFLGQDQKQIVSIMPILQCSSLRQVESTVKPLFPRAAEIRRSHPQAKMPDQASKNAATMAPPSAMLGLSEMANATGSSFSFLRTAISQMREIHKKMITGNAQSHVVFP